MKITNIYLLNMKEEHKERKSYYKVIDKKELELIVNIKN